MMTREAPQETTQGWLELEAAGRGHCPWNSEHIWEKRGRTCSRNSKNVLESHSLFLFIQKSQVEKFLNIYLFEYLNIYFVFKI